MKKLINLIITSLIIFGAQASSAVVLTFEDVPGGSIQNRLGQMPQLGQVPTYKGFSFSPTLYWVDVVGSAWNYGAHENDEFASEFALSNQQSGTGIIIEASTVDFTFGGLWAKKWNTPVDSGDTSSDPILTGGFLSGYKDDIMVWQVLNTTLNGSYNFFEPQTGPIDELRLGFGNYFLVDDIVLNAVPVPAAVWLFGSGLLGLIAVARRKTQA